ncbi:MAG: murein biosynthesis integral membrane protein MurJ [Longimicrobiales bacterium]
MSEVEGSGRPSSAEASDQESPGPAALETADGPKAPLPRGSAHLVAAGIFLSRIAGIVRTRVMAHYFGISPAADAFNAALKIPNVLQNLLGEGTLSASFIPVYSRLLKEGRKEDAGRLAGAIFAILTVLAAAFALLGYVFAPQLVSIVAWGFDDEYRRTLTIRCLRIIFPMTSILVLSAWALGIQNSHRKFFASYVAPVMWNAAMIVTLLLYGRAIPGLKDAALLLAQSGLTVTLAWGALIGGVLQFLVQLPFVFRLERSLRVRWDTEFEPVREVMRTAGPAIAGRGVVQLSSYLDLVLAGKLAAGSVAAMSNALILYMLPISLFGMSVAAAELPDLARQSMDSTDVLRERVNAGLRQIYYFVVPSFISFLVLGDVIVACVMQTGQFRRDATLQVYAILAAYSLGLIASTGTRLFSSTFFALKDTRTPARTAIQRVVLAAVVGGGLMLPFDKVHVSPALTLGAVGLGLGSSLAGWMEWALLRRSLTRKIGAIGAGPPLVKMFIAAIVSAAAGRGVATFISPESAVMRAGAVIPVVGLLYLAITYRMGLPQARAVIGRVTRR